MGNTVSYNEADDMIMFGIPLDHGSVWAVLTSDFNRKTTGFSLEDLLEVGYEWAVPLSDTFQPLVKNRSLDTVHVSSILSKIFDR